jgi:ubiquinone/menaquinone biosynthesis C-methylase UbiE
VSHPHAYDVAAAALDRLGLGPLRADLTRGVSGRVVELGAGTGRQLAHYDAGVDLTIVEPDAAALELARRRRPDARAVVGRAESLPFADRSYDWAIIALSLCTIARPDLALAEIRRVLDRDGRLRVLEHVRSPARSIARAQAILTPAWSRIAGGCHLDRDSEAEIEGAGFEITARRRMLAGHLILLEARPRRGDPEPASGG